MVQQQRGEELPGDHEGDELADAEHRVPAKARMNTWLPNLPACPVRHR